MLLGILTALLVGFIVQHLVAVVKVVRSTSGSPGWLSLFQPGAFLPNFLLPGHWRLNLSRKVSWALKADLYRKPELDSTVLVVPHVFPAGVTVLVGEGEAIKIINSDHRHFAKTAGLNSPVLNMWGPNILITDGADWRRHRKVVAPSFSEQNNEVVWTETLRSGRQWFEHVDSGMVEGKSVVRNVEKDTATMTLMVIAKAAFGYELNWPDKQEQGEDSSMDFCESARIVLDNLPLIYALPRFLFSLSAKLQRIKLGAEYFDAHMRKLIEDRRVEGGERHDLLAALLDASDQEAGHASLSDEELLSDVKIFAFAGHETSANTLAATLVLLALYPASQARIHAEATAVFGASDDQPTSHADLQSLPFTYAVLQEGLRLAGPVGFVAKTCIKETTLPARTAAGEKIVVRVPEGALVRENVSAVHYSEHIWEDPYKFDPDRFMAHAGSKDDPDGWLPFSSGLRGCIGRQFSIAESVCFLALCLLRYHIEIPEHRQAEWALREGEGERDRRERILKARWTVTLAPHDLDLTFVRRESSA